MACRGAGGVFITFQVSSGQSHACAVHQPKLVCVSWQQAGRLTQRTPWRCASNLCVPVAWVVLLLWLLLDMLLHLWLIVAVVRSCGRCSMVAKSLTSNDTVCVQAVLRLRHMFCGTSYPLVVVQLTVSAFAS